LPDGAVSDLTEFGGWVDRSADNRPRSMKPLARPAHRGLQEEVEVRQESHVPSLLIISELKSKRRGFSFKENGVS
jgi:hypothetical protein